jgi:hypothetical protein
LVYLIMTREKQWKATHNHIFEWVSELRDNIVQVKVKMQIIFSLFSILDF